MSKLLTAKVVSLVAVVVLGAATAAAATGSLPGPATDALAKVGLPVHHSSHHAATADADNDPADAHASANANGPSEHALFGLCTAQAASAGHPALTSTISTVDCSNPPPHPGNKGGVSDQHRQAPPNHPAPNDHASSTATNGAAPAAPSTTDHGASTVARESHGPNTASSNASDTGADHAHQHGRP